MIVEKPSTEGDSFGYVNSAMNMMLNGAEPSIKSLGHPAEVSESLKTVKDATPSQSSSLSVLMAAATTPRTSKAKKRSSPKPTSGVRKRPRKMDEPESFGGKKMKEEEKLKPDDTKLEESAEALEGNSTGRWTSAEDELLRTAVQKIGARNWKRVAAEYLNNTRTDVQCLHRWQKVLRPGLVKGPWTKEEDDMIIKCKMEGMTKWSEIATHVTGRIGKQCRERWFNHLDPSILKTEWTEEEDKKLIEGQALLGNRWSQIAKLFLPGRPENAVKNRWNAATRRRRVGKKKTPKKEGRAKKKKEAKSLKNVPDFNSIGEAMEGMVSLAMSGAVPLANDHNIGVKSVNCSTPRQKKTISVSTTPTPARAQARIISPSNVRKGLSGPPPVFDPEKKNSACRTATGVATTDTANAFLKFVSALSNSKSDLKV
mmetsp:Transcript_9814/g.11188  ORF Transcript_9814/g.11188 Transcript_9814/m.11188 type:complete len:427 (+) Transcript_9814:265-1545(+)